MTQFMNLALINDNTTAPTMSSREIAELTDKRHDNVMRDIRTMLVELYGEGGLLRFEDTLINEQNGQAYPVYNLPKRETLILISGYSVALRAKIIDRWTELETGAAPQFHVPRNYAEALRLAAEQQEHLAELQAVNQAMVPKVEAFDRIATSDGSLCMRDAAKSLQIRPIDLTRELVTRSWIYRRPGTTAWIAYQDRITAGLMEHKVTSIPQPDGTDRVTIQARVTPKGLTKLASLLGSEIRDLAEQMH